MTVNTTASNRLETASGLPTVNADRWSALHVFALDGLRFVCGECGVENHTGTLLDLGHAVLFSYDAPEQVATTAACSDCNVFNVFKKVGGEYLTP